jgi:hypothetical protein
MILFIAMYVTIIWVQETLLMFIPNVQFTTLLIVLFATNFKFKDSSVMILAYVILDNLAYGFTFHIIPMYIGWMVIPSLYLFVKTKNEYIHASLGILFALLYSWAFVPMSVYVYGISFQAYIIADISFEIVLAASNFITILFLYPYLDKVLSYIVTTIKED